MNKEMIYDRVKVKGKTSSLTPREKLLIDLTIEAIDECVIDEVTTVTITKK